MFPSPNHTAFTGAAQPKNVAAGARQMRHASRGATTRPHGYSIDHSVLNVKKVGVYISSVAKTE